MVSSWALKCIILTSHFLYCFLQTFVFYQIQKSFTFLFLTSYTFAESRVYYVSFTFVHTTYVLPWLTLSRAGKVEPLCDRKGKRRTTAHVIRVTSRTFGLVCCAFFVRGSFLCKEKNVLTFHVSSACAIAITLQTYNLKFSFPNKKAVEMWCSSSSVIAFLINFLWS
jgi:hypothetical protein